MVKPQWIYQILLLTGFLSTTVFSAEQVGSIRGMVYDKDFDAPLPAAQILIAETEQTVTASDEGNFVFAQVPPGTYTLIFSKIGYTRQIKANVVVLPGKLTEVKASLSGEFTEMEEFVVQDVQIGSGTETALLELRLGSPSLMDSISADLMSRAGASDAADALKLVTGATVEDGKFAVIRGLPDRYVSSQMNGVRLPTADEDKRAVQLDQFPSTVIESIQVSKTFTPDQQGDASGGAVNIILKSIPDKPMFDFNFETSANTQVTGRNDFLTYKGGGVNAWAQDDGSRDIQTKNIGGNWDGAVGVSRGDAPADFKWSLASGGKYEFDDGVKIGGFGSFFYERDSSFFDNGVDDKYWVESLPLTGGDRSLTPQYSRGSPQEGSFLTELFDVTRGSEEVNLGGLGTIGLETENHSLNMVYMFTRVAEDVTTLAENTRGKKSLHKFWPKIFGPEFVNYDPSDPTHPGNQDGQDASPYLRTETLEYTERTTKTLQFSGNHKLFNPEFEIDDLFTSLDAELDWGISYNTANMDQPDKRVFGSEWRPFAPSTSGFVPVHFRFKPAASFTLGNLQRVWKNISEKSKQYFWNLKLPFEQWSGDKGYLKFGVFNDNLTRKYNQESFSNFNDTGAQFQGSFQNFWSRAFPSEDHSITAAEIDVDYDGEQNISAWYYMIDLPLTSKFRLIGGVRYENTKLSIVNHPESQVKWIPPGATSSQDMNPGDGDVDFSQKDALPSLGLVFTPTESLTLRGSYSETIARQTFKELSPIQQQEFLGGDIFIGNPNLQMSAIKNYDLRLDYSPYKGSLVSFSYFHKDIKDPIEFVQKVVGFTFTTPVNYPKGKLEGYEFELRQDMGRFWKSFDGLSLGTNATFINSEVTLPADEAAQFDQPSIAAPMKTRDMTNTPEHLYNVFMTYDLDRTGTQFGLFYTVRGDTLIAGAGQRGKFIPSVYETEFGTLNASISQKIGENWVLKFQAKNLLNPAIETVFRSKFVDGGDVTKTSYRKGIELTLNLSGTF